jgi:hypothetical protein
MSQSLDLRVCMFAILAPALSASGAGHIGGMADDVGGPFTDAPVLEAPFSADAATVLTATLPDGTRRTESATARYYRDAAGRVRVEQIARDVQGRDSATERTTFITIDEQPGDGVVFTLDPRRAIARPQGRRILGAVFSGGRTFALPVDSSRFRFRVYWGPRDNGAAESLGGRTIEGIETVGRRVTTLVPADRFGNENPAEIVDERWVSPALQLVIYALTVDPIAGVLEYRLTNIRREPPSPDLFVVPPDYIVDNCPQRDDPCFAAEPLPQANRADRGHGPIVE